MSETSPSMREDRARPVRPGEELDRNALRGALDEPLGGLSDDFEVEQFPGGHSNLTYLIRDGARELVLRRPPRGAKEIKAGHDMEREYRILSALHPIWPKAPRPFVYVSEDESPIGAPFYVMERVRGVILRGAPEWLEVEALRRVSESAIDTLAEIHAIDFEAAGLAGIGRPEGYLLRQVEGWTRRYEKAATDCIAEMDALAGWLASSRPAEGPPALVHNDFKLDNLVLDPADLSRVRAVLDWEMSTIGDPLADLGTALAYWIDPDDPAELRALELGAAEGSGNLTRVEVVERYVARTGRPAGDMLFYYALALFKVAVIAQQIYGRYRRGFTADERFARMIGAVRVLSRAGISAIERGTI